MKKLILIALGLLTITTSNYPCCGDGGGWGWGLFGLGTLATTAAIASSRPKETVIYQQKEPDEEAIQKAYRAGADAEKQRLDAYKAGVEAGQKQVLGA